MLEVYKKISQESDDDKHKAYKVLGALENHFNSGDNEVIEQRFWRIQYQEPFDKIPYETQKEKSSLQLSGERQNDER